MKSLIASVLLFSFLMMVTPLRSQTGPPMPAAMALAVPSPAASPTVSIDFNPVPGADGYNLYFGSQSRGYTNRVDIGTLTKFAIGGLTPGVKYFFAVTARAGALESDFSSEGSWTVSSGPQLPTIILSTKLLIRTNATDPWSTYASLPDVFITNASGAPMFQSVVGITWTNR